MSASGPVVGAVLLGLWTGIIVSFFFPDSKTTMAVTTHHISSTTRQAVASHTRAQPNRQPLAPATVTTMPQSSHHTLQATGDESHAAQSDVKFATLTGLSLILTAVAAVTTWRRYFRPSPLQPSEPWQMAAAFRGFGAAPKNPPKENKPKFKKGEEPCACGSLQPYVSCCQPYHLGEKYPETAMDLLRARFSAFANRKREFVKQTIDPEHLTIRNVTENRLIDEIEFCCTNFLYDQLIIMNDEPGATEDEHWVKFRYWYRFTANVKGQAKIGEQRTQTEKSLFRKRDGKWMFVDTPAEFQDATTFRVGDTSEEQTDVLMKAKDAATAASAKAAGAVLSKMGLQP